MSGWASPVPNGRPARRILLGQVLGVLVIGLGLFHPLERALAAGLGEGMVSTIAAVAITAGATAYVINRLFIRRLRRLNAVLEEVAAGDLERKLPAKAGGEIGQLTASIERMIGTLRSNYDELKTNDDLRRQLIANVSHELRTPLTSIQGYLETAKLAGPESPDFARNLDICIRESKKLSRLVQDLFELSKLDTQHLEFHFEVVSLVELADQVGLAFEQRMEEKGIEFSTSFPDDALEVLGDGNRLGQVITNLLGNAAVFTREGGRVELRCERVGPRACLTVADTGIGIPEGDLPHIFESFFHLEKSRTRNLGGTGLGLAICKAIVEAHGGEISVESVVGEGTSFHVGLDLAPEVDDD